MLSSLLSAIIIGAIAGWLAGQIVKGSGQGLVMNIVVGIIGALIASWLFPLLSLGLFATGSTIGAIVHSTLGAVIFLFILSLFNRRSA